MTIEQILQYIFSGITIGSIYAIVAIGFNIIYNATGIINFAQGEFVMLGGMIAYTFTNYIPLPVAIIFSVIITVFIGALIELIFIRGYIFCRITIISFGVLFIFSAIFNIYHKLHIPFFLYLLSMIIISTGLSFIIFYTKKSIKTISNKSFNVLEMIIVTIGLSMFIRELALNIWDESVRALPFFTGNEITSINVLGAYISPQVLWIVGISALIVIILTIFFKFTIIGQAMRACAANKTSASLCGINIKNMVTLAFMISAGIGALAGCVVSPLTQTQYDMGTGLAIKGFTVAILGGLGNSTGAVLAGIILGLLESFSISIFPMAYKDVIAIIILLAILFFKPSGLFVSKQAGELKEF